MGSFNHSAGSIALVIINIVFYDVGFVGFSAKPLVTNITTPMAALPSSLAKTKPKPNKNATATRIKKETIVTVYATTVPDT
jgi:hypothetical protein